MRREFREELDVTLGAVGLLGATENLFEYEGRRGHEIVHVFAVGGPELDAIPLDARLRVLDEGSPVGWVPLGALGRPLYPNGVLGLLAPYSSFCSVRRFRLVVVGLYRAFATILASFVFVLPTSMLSCQ